MCKTRRRHKSIATVTGQSRGPTSKDRTKTTATITLRSRPLDANASSAGVLPICYAENAVPSASFLAPRSHCSRTIMCLYMHISRFLKQGRSHHPVTLQIFAPISHHSMVAAVGGNMHLRICIGGVRDPPPIQIWLLRDRLSHYCQRSS